MLGCYVEKQRMSIAQIRRAARSAVTDVDHPKKTTMQAFTQELLYGKYRADPSTQEKPLAVLAQRMVGA